MEELLCLSALCCTSLGVGWIPWSWLDRLGWARWLESARYLVACCQLDAWAAQRFRRPTQPTGWLEWPVVVWMGCPDDNNSSLKRWSGSRCSSGQRDWAAQRWCRLVDSTEQQLRILALVSALSRALGGMELAVEYVELCIARAWQKGICSAHRCCCGRGKQDRRKFVTGMGEWVIARQH